MAEQVLGANIAQINPVDVLEKVSSFYNDAWGKLVFVVSISLFIVGVIVPILIQFYQRMSLTLQKERLQKDLLDKLNSKINYDIENKFTDEMKKLNQEFNNFKSDIRKDVSYKVANLHHVQSLQYFINCSYSSACMSAISSAQEYLEADKDISNFRTVIRIIIEKCLPKMTRKDVSNIEEKGYRFEELLEYIKKKNVDGRFSDLIEEFRKNLDSALKRES